MLQFVLLAAMVRAAAPAPSAAPVAQASPDAQASPEAQASPNAQASAGPNTGAAPKPTPNAGLLGDFGHGERSNLAAHGLTLNGHFVTESAANLSGGLPIGGNARERATAVSSEFGFGFDADFNKIYAGSGAGILHFLLTTRFGSNLSSEAIGNLASVEEIYGDGQTTRITFLDYEQPLAKKRLDLRFGKYNQQNDFIAGSTYWGGNLYCFYQNNNICGTPAGIPTNNGVTPGGSAGYNYYPSSMLGARIKVSPNDSVYVEAAALQVDPIVNTSHGGFYFGLYGSTGAELPLEIGLTLHNHDGERIGDVRFGGYYDTSNVFNYVQREESFAIPGNASNAAGLASLPIEYVRGRSGAYVQLDQLVQGSSDKGKRGTAVFAAAEYSDPNTALLTTYVDGGIVRHGTFTNR
jgi:porin